VAATINAGDRAAQDHQDHEDHRAVKKLWIVTIAMVGCGLALALGSALAGLGPVALVCGVLLIWSGMVKVIVLRVWRATLHAAPLPEPTRPGMRSSSALGKPT
jgi:hypothetical protein